MLSTDRTRRRVDDDDRGGGGGRSGEKSYPDANEEITGHTFYDHNLMDFIGLFGGFGVFECQKSDKFGSIEDLFSMKKCSILLS